MRFLRILRHDPFSYTVQHWCGLPALAGLYNEGCLLQSLVGLKVSVLVCSKDFGLLFKYGFISNLLLGHVFNVFDLSERHRERASLCSQSNETRSLCVSSLLLGGPLRLRMADISISKQGDKTPVCHVVILHTYKICRYRVNEGIAFHVVCQEFS